MFYLKYRPKTLKEIDNSKVKETLVKLLNAKEIPHALLFIGQKGTGKTSAARIFAKAVNCLDNKFADIKSLGYEPCNQCANCSSISNSSFTDVLELDAASNRGIEEVKSLIRETAFLPMAGRFRVFIIDEVHMITPDGFNALLKTLEEPPKSAIFILATTNQEKLPKTIISRCLKVNFGKAGKNDLISMLNRILKNEQIQLSAEIVDLIALHSDESFRDAAKILEEFIVQKIVTIDEAEKYLGLRGKNNLLPLIEEADIKKVLVWVDEFAISGGSFKNLLQDVLEKLRLALLSKKGYKQENDTPCKLSVSEITMLIKLLMEAYQNLKYSPIESLPLEIALVEFYNQSNKSLKEN